MRYRYTYTVHIRDTRRGIHHINNMHTQVENVVNRFFNKASADGNFVDVEVERRMSVMIE